MAFDSEHSPEIAPLQVAGERQDVLRKLLQPLVQEAIEKEFERFIGAGRWERARERRGWRNGSRRRKLTTRVGRIELRFRETDPVDFSRVCLSATKEANRPWSWP